MKHYHSTHLHCWLSRARARLRLDKTSDVRFRDKGSKDDDSEPTFPSLWWRWGLFCSGRVPKTTGRVSLGGCVRWKTWQCRAGRTGQSEAVKDSKRYAARPLLRRSHNLRRRTTPAQATARLSEKAPPSKKNVTLASSGWDLTNIVSIMRHLLVF